MLNTEFKFDEVHVLTEQIEVGADRVHSRHIFSNANGGVALIAMKAGQRLDKHLAPAELMVTVLEGEIEFTVIEKPHMLRAGEFILVGEGVPHSVVANADSKFMLTKIKGDK